MLHQNDRWKRRLGLRLGAAAVLLAAAAWLWMQMASLFDGGLEQAPTATMFGLAGFALALIAAVLLAPPIAGFAVWLFWPSERAFRGAIPLRYLAAQQAADAGRHDEAFNAFAEAAQDGDAEAWPYRRMLEIAIGPLDDPQRFENALDAGRERLEGEALAALERHAAALKSEDRHGS